MSHACHSLQLTAPANQPPLPTRSVEKDLISFSSPRHWCDALQIMEEVAATRWTGDRVSEGYSPPKKCAVLPRLLGDVMGNHRI